MSFRRFLTTLGVSGLMLVPATAARAAEEPALDAEFLKAAHQINLAEIAAGRIAFQKSTDTTVKNVAATFMRDHIRLDANLYLTARDLGVQLPAAPTEEQTAVAERYRAAGADTFDEYYIQTQLSGHREAVKLTETQIAEGSNAAVRKLAESAAPIIATHGDLLRAAAAEEGLVGYEEGGARN
ncbi:DUF4142 domain-containing protein [Actinoplanes sp. NPDC051861]|uniref:DUF4142 domain-containing protein n=1 Tax=Actinoplanes sp. NPDC051861 TaxID=3155170 RepID=UPI00341C04FE